MLPPVLCHNVAPELGYVRSSVDALDCLAVDVCLAADAVNGRERDEAVNMPVLGSIKDCGFSRLLLYYYVSLLHRRLDVRAPVCAALKWRCQRATPHRRRGPYKA